MGITQPLDVQKIWANLTNSNVNHFGPPSGSKLLGGPGQPVHVYPQLSQIGERDPILSVNLMDFVGAPINLIRNKPAKQHADDTDHQAAQECRDDPINRECIGQHRRQPQ